MKQQDKQSSGRLAFIDWTRGLAALIMLQGHTFNSFTRTDLRPQGPYMLSQFVGGLPPAAFLFLTGITFAFLMDSQERKGASTWNRIWAALKRSRYLFLIAFLFRIQLYVFGYPTSPASELLRVDILNCMGFAMLLLAPMAAFSTLERVRLCTILGCLIAMLAPLVRVIDLHALPAPVRSYLIPDLNQFGFFPWASFLAFGMTVGSIFRVIRPEDMQRTLLWMLGVGVSVATFAHYLSNLPYSIYPKVEFWLDSPGLIAIKIGILLCMLALAYVWVNLAGAQRWSLLRQLGTTSLLVYWVHVELVYGRWFGVWKEGLTILQVVVYTVLLIALMTLLSIGQTRFGSLNKLLNWRSGQATLPEPGRVSGD
jgi:uncharacterized membrane protein